MLSSRRALVTMLVVVGALGLAGCTPSGEPEAADSADTGSRTGVAASGSAPIVFAFVCGTGDGDATETYSTYAAAWEAERTDCSAKPVTGTEPSAQQEAAVSAADEGATLQELAATCAERGVAPWTAPVSSPAEAGLAAGLLEYCPGHPERDRLQDALRAYRG
ncbi:MULTISPECIES: hypothetical protein [unclassified Curtobacterium]|uniref:hypothetical protein n=1 Tax=unclassified Curtobacterium TaxID=257496 RepID=UPI000824647C|nr:MULTISPECIES: hypothetical protein [unclassified Curtobacterium]WIA98183.1 hypothetical protein QOL16_07290 [Curtobacterium sp. MCBA15_004]